MASTTSILVFATSNYDAMKKFLADFGFQVAEGHDQLLPLFCQARAARVSRGELEFNLEESAVADQKAFFHLMLSDYSDAEIEKIKSLGYECATETSLYGTFHTFQTPDGGRFVL
jgi:hypothetical protein